MEPQELLKLKEKYAKMSEEELIEFLLVDKEEYEPQAYSLLCQEAKKRGLEDKIEERRKSSQPVDITLGDEELKTEEFVGIIIVNDYDDQEYVESLLERKDIPYTDEKLNLSGAVLPLSFAVEKSRLEEALNLLRNFKPKNSYVLW